MNPRRYSKIEQALNILDKSGTVDILKEDHYLLFLFKKTERVAAALYVLTSLFPDVEPLKWTLRESAAELLRLILSGNERATTHSKEFLSDTLSEMARLFSLIDLAHIADLLSPMNFSVLKKEIENIVGIMEGKWRTGNIAASPHYFDESFFGLPKEIFASESSKADATAPLSSFIEPVSDDTSLRSFSEFERFKRSQKDIDKGHQDVKDSVLNKKTGRESERAKPTPATTNKRHEYRSVDHTKEERKERILSVLRQQQSAMIKDFSGVITGCSEKTIQRLLIELVRSGILRREGARRWSRYLLTPATPLPTVA